MPILEQATGQSGLFDQRDVAVSQARIYADAVHRWILVDKQRFLTFTWIFRAVAQEGIPIQQGTIPYYARDIIKKHGYELSDDRMFKHNRNNWMALTRYMHAFYPELKKYLRANPSAVDNLTLKAIPYEYLEGDAQCKNRPITRKDWG